MYISHKTRAEFVCYKLKNPDVRNQKDLNRDTIFMDLNVQHSKHVSSLQIDPYI